MRKINLLFLSILIILTSFACTKKIPEDQLHKKKAEFGLVIHGGAGWINKDRYSDEQIKEYKDKLLEALNRGNEILSNGGSALDAVQNTINVMENSPLFNSGKGAVFAANGMNELDASIMDGKTNNAGAVAGVHHIKNPISLARLVMDKSKHVMLSGDGAEEFAKQFPEIEIVDQKYFYTKHSWESLQNAKASENKKQSNIAEFNNWKFGTVGCVALDKSGNLAAGTSTGGMTNKKFGRIGDSPIIGAGTYADNNSCAISATGHGEFFIRNVVASDISALIKYKGMSLKDAASYVIKDKLVKQDALGGVIGIDKYGDITMPFNTQGMFRGFMLDGKNAQVKLFGDE